MRGHFFLMHQAGCGTEVSVGIDYVLIAFDSVEIGHEVLAGLIEVTLGRLSKSSFRRSIASTVDCSGNKLSPNIPLPKL